MLSIKWPMAASLRNRRMGSACRLLAAAASISILAGCSLLPQEEELEKLPAIQIPKISQKPEYSVKRGTLELKVSGSGKLMSEREEILYFTEDNQRITDVYVKAGDKVKKGQVLAELDTGNMKNQILRKEIELEKTGLDLKELLREASGDNEILLRKQELEYKLQKEELAELQSALADSKLTAPYDGTIVSFTAEKGDMTKSYEKVGQIADMDALVVAVQFSSGDLKHIAPGMETVVGINTAGDHMGKVRRLPVSGSQQEEDSLDSYALIDLKKLPESVQHGTPLSASVIIERQENALYIPSAALRKQNGRHYVLVSNADGSKGEVDVEIGVQTVTDVEIIKGLKEGQKVVGK
ncbi:efflux RND transporter periplasmic adaptor subunit [Paenibacillus spongiae]|uniref:Efflux RND transporter periplasmic adaptor subunit n=1 Tax=Paenibacillus spongiae TaxID=2909671 RepID=A0ABY5S5B7_9BACL|nr:efflux RND transporter periplasmic adaptor subunit [Paenibacillus spongiae]UVI28688.1 efflux RND transporter periplasmic adaptor subunit [Paenibacillus spongiae]